MALASEVADRRASMADPLNESDQVSWKISSTCLYRAVPVVR